MRAVNPIPPAALPLPPAPPAPKWMRELFFAVVLIFPIIDLVMAVGYDMLGMRQVIALRYLRDFACLLLAMVAFASPAFPARMRLSILCYLVFLGMYAAISLLVGEYSLAVVFGTLGVLLIPFTLTLAAFSAVRTVEDVRRLLHILIAYALLSTFFGMWEINHTEFWTNTVRYGNYLRDVKNIKTGYNPAYMLPWNFHGFENVRRAAGLLCAPLAQGFFLAVVGVAALAYLRGRALWQALLVAAICFVGVEMSMTRGALLTLVLALGLYLLAPTSDTKRRKTNLALVVVLGLLSFQVLMYHFMYTLNLADDSTMGHLKALQKNLRGSFDVLLFGHGVGAAGSITSSSGLQIEGGGEGAIFTILYQLGMPGVLVFLSFYLTLLRRIYRERRAHGTHGELARAITFLGVGVSLSMFTSEHIHTFSGMGAFWFLAGGYLGYVQHQQRWHASAAKGSPRKDAAEIRSARPDTVPA